MTKFRRRIAREILFGKTPGAYEIWKIYQIVFCNKTRKTKVVVK